MFERTEIAESIYESVVESSNKNLPRQRPTALVTEGIREENPLHRGLVPRRVRALTSIENDM